MDNLQFMIAQGSTPRIELALPFEADPDATAYVTISQNDTVRREYNLNGTAAAPGIAGTGTLALEDGDPSMLVLEMTQADTLALAAGDAELQVRILTEEGCDTFFPLVGAVVRSMKKGVIT